VIPVSSSTLLHRAFGASVAGVLLRLLALVGVVVGLVVMTPAAQGWGESTSNDHTHAASVLHASGTGHGVGDSRPSVDVPTSVVTEAIGAAALPKLALLPATAAAAIALLLAALGMAVARARWRDATLGILPHLVVRRVVRTRAWLPSPPSPAALSVFRI
jgi:hypothetical protein